MTHPCGNRTRHGKAIGCCPGCRRLFSSDSSFDRHKRADGTCRDPEQVGLVARPSKTHPDEAIWGRRATGADWTVEAFPAESGDTA